MSRPYTCGTRRPGKLAKMPSGRRFGELAVLRPENRNLRRRVMRYRCLCTCGEEVVIDGDRLRAGKRLTCGKNGHFIGKKCIPGRRLHFMAEYAVWRRIQDRCYNPEHKSYRWYGAKGITVHQPWRDSFEAFLLAVVKRPSRRHFFARIDKTRPYEPGNVEWRLRTCEPP